MSETGLSPTWPFYRMASLEIEWRLARAHPAASQPQGLVADDEGGGDAETNASIVSETREPIAVTPPRVRAALSVGPAGHVRLQLTLHVNAGDSKISSPAPTTSPAEVAVSASSSGSSSYAMPTG